MCEAHTHIHTCVCVSVCRYSSVVVIVVVVIIVLLLVDDAHLLEGEATTTVELVTDKHEHYDRYDENYGSHYDDRNWDRYGQHCR